ncbi:hypothetical protein Ahu01nite_068330 [Winogradskya humida]|uniref:Orc1-like AAA ATPase domain-containing protein n=1 Tax=Winogradskya humida TaxID=113566 RepID=A0ABQ3ZYR0_9ACTN|nr:hypothetical protein Ahu01nite_068330 [Actinoplanes humidus]
MLRRTLSRGTGAVIAVTGEGSAAFVTALRDRAAGFATGRAAAPASGGIAPLAPLLTALRSGPAPVLSQADFGALAAYASQPIWLVDRLAGQLRARAATTALLVCVEDLQWADAVTRYALRVLPGQLAASPIVWTLTSRIPLDLVADDVPVQEITLGSPEPLTAVVLAQQRVQRAVRTLLDSLPPAVREPLVAAAALGPSFPADSLAVELLAALLRDGLLIEDGGRLRFREELVRKALLI